MSVTEEATARAPQSVFDLGVPVLGICYGMQTMAGQLGGRVEAGKVREFGYAEVRARGHTRLFEGIEDFRTPEGHGMLKVWMSHGDKVTQMPAGFKLMASTDACPIAAMADEARRFYAVQFHPEVTHTVQGAAILRRFVNDICGCVGDWNMPDYAIRGDRAHPRAGGQGRSDSRTFRRSRFFGRCGADPSRHRQAAHLRVRRPRPAAFERSRAGDGDLRQESGRQGDPRRRQRRFHGQARRRRRPGAKAQDHRTRIRRGVPERSGQDQKRTNGWRRAPSIPM